MILNHVMRLLVTLCLLVPIYGLKVDFNITVLNCEHVFAGFLPALQTPLLQDAAKYLETAVDLGTMFFVNSTRENVKYARYKGFFEDRDEMNRLPMGQISEAQLKQVSTSLCTQIWDQIKSNRNIPKNYACVQTSHLQFKPIVYAVCRFEHKETFGEASERIKIIHNFDPKTLTQTLHEGTFGQDAQSLINQGLGVEASTSNGVFIDCSKEFSSVLDNRLIVNSESAKSVKCALDNLNSFLKPSDQFVTLTRSERDMFKISNYCDMLSKEVSKKVNHNLWYQSGHLSCAIVNKKQVEHQDILSACCTPVPKFESIGVLDCSEAVAKKIGRHLLFSPTVAKTLYQQIKVKNTIASDSVTLVGKVEPADLQMPSNDATCSMFVNGQSLWNVGSAQMIGCAYKWNGAIAEIYCRTASFNQEMSTRTHIGISSIICQKELQDAMRASIDAFNKNQLPYLQLMSNTDKTQQASFKVLNRHEEMELRARQSLQSTNQHTVNLNQLESVVPYIPGMTDSQYCAIAVKDWVNRHLLSKYMFQESVNSGCAKDAQETSVKIACHLF